MYLSFNLNTHKDFKDYKAIGEEIFNGQKKKVFNELEKYCYSGTATIDGSKLAEDWFPEIECDVFLSHSHKDREQVLGLAGWLKKRFGLTAFIDSSIWGNSEQLLKKIDDEYCYDEANHMYDYNLRNYSTSHVHMMLSMSLLKMVDKAEALIFVNTPNSISPISETINQTTKSPWIYSELVYSSLIRRSNPKRVQSVTEGKMIFNEARSLDIGYDVQKYLDKQIKLDDRNIDYWAEKYIDFLSRREYVHPLDCLYAQFNIGTKTPSTIMR